MIQSPSSPLQSALKKYGLDPREWRVVPAGDRHFVVRHRKDESFTFAGRVRRRGPRLEWATLRLRSI